MRNFSRRRLLSIGTTGLVCGLSGCVGTFRDNSQRTQLGELSAYNRDPEPHTVHVLFINDEEPIYTQSRKVPANDNGSPGRITFEGYPSRAGESHLYVRVDSEEYKARNHRDMSEYDSRCLSLQFTIKPQEETDQSYLYISRSSDTRYCDMSPASSE